MRRRWRFIDHRFISVSFTRESVNDLEAFSPLTVWILDISIRPIFVTPTQLGGMFFDAGTLCSFAHRCRDFRIDPTFSKPTRIASIHCRTVPHLFGFRFIPLGMRRFSDDPNHKGGHHGNIYRCEIAIRCNHWEGGSIRNQIDSESKEVRMTQRTQGPPSAYPFRIKQLKYDKMDNRYMHGKIPTSAEKIAPEMSRQIHYILRNVTLPS